MFTFPTTTSKISNILYIASGLALGSSFFYWYVYKPNIQAETDRFSPTIETRVIESYENKYYDKYYKLTERTLSEQFVKGLKHNVLFEHTPKGGIIMYYDFDKESFIYYCDTKEVPYLFLETVARKYAITYDCKQILVDIKKELETATENMKHTKDTPVTPNTSDNDSNIFASFKSYNRKGSGGSKSVNKTFVLRQNANRYSYHGKVNTFQFIKPHEYKVDDPVKTLDYESFKKLMSTGKPTVLTTK